ncbi:MAG: LysR substrate-binding domain-containing protein [Clostridiaceae bacterium]
MDLDRLNEFVVLASFLSFRRAADQLTISQPILSARIASLEKSIGIPLFDRDTHCVSLTEEGKRFLKDARELTQLDSGIRTRLASVGADEYRSLRIIMSGFSVVPLLGPFLDVYNARYPNLHLELLDDTAFGFFGALGNAGVDLYFTYDPSPAAFPDLQRKLLLTTSLCAFLPKDHKLAYQSTLSLEMLDGENIIPWPETKDTYMRNYQLGLLDKRGIRYFLYQSNVSPFFFLLLVPIGKGLVLCPWIMRGMTPPNSVCIPIEGKGTNVSMYMYYRSSNMNPLLNDFITAFESWIQTEERSI